MTDEQEIDIFDELEEVKEENKRLRDTMATIAHLAEGTRIGGMARAVLEGK